MKIIDPGHTYDLDLLDSQLEGGVRLSFVKREGPGYPGNLGRHPGTNIQEVLRALIHRIRYLNAQIPDQRNVRIIMMLQQSIWLLEERAANRHMREWNFELTGIELFPTCPKCKHIGCKGECHT